jgi:hypothetical protein
MSGRSVDGSVRFSRRFAAMALGLLAFAAGTAMAQSLPLPDPTPPSDYASVVDPDSAPPVTVPVFAPSYDAGEGPEPVGPRITTGLFDTISGSLFGDVYAEGRWRPLSLRTFFTEGWNEAWASGPAGSQGLTPRHGWLSAFDGVFYRLWFTQFGYQNNINTSFGGNRYTGDYVIFLPFSRRFEVAIDVPFVVSNGTRNKNFGYTSQFGDLTIIPRVLLSETKSTTQLFALAVRTPTGTQTTINDIMALTPRYEFWSNPVGPWVARGSSGFFVPLNRVQAPIQTAYTGGLAVGRYFRPHDVPFGDLVFFGDSNYLVPLEGGASRNTVISVGAGTRFHITDNFFFLNNWEVPVTGPHPFTYNVTFALLKVF